MSYIKISLIVFIFRKLLARKLGKINFPFKDCNFLSSPYMSFWGFASAKEFSLSLNKKKFLCEGEKIKLARNKKIFHAHCFKQMFMLQSYLFYVFIFYFRLYDSPPSAMRTRCYNEVPTYSGSYSYSCNLGY